MGIGKCKSHTSQMDGINILFTYLAKFGIVGRHFIFLFLVGIGYVRCIVPAGDSIGISSAIEFLAQFVEKGLSPNFFFFDVLINRFSWLHSLEKYKNNVAVWNNDNGTQIFLETEYIPITTPRTQTAPTLSSLWIIEKKTQNYMKYVNFAKSIHILYIIFFPATTIY